MLHDKARAGDVSFFKSALDGLDERELITGQTPLMACLAGKSGC